MRSDAMPSEIRTYAELQREMCEALRRQHPEWIEPDGESKLCRTYEARFAALLDIFRARHNCPSV